MSGSSATRRMPRALSINSREVLVLYRKHSGGTAFRDEGTLLAGVFLIQRLEGSRLGMPTLWVLNGWVEGEGSGKEKLTLRGRFIRASQADSLRPCGKEAGDAGTRVAMVLGDALES
jgi:hypothetical protein